MKKLISISFATFILIGCGGGGGSAPSNDNFKKVDSIGYFEDAPIAGASYKCGDKTGTTGKDGKFNYTTNEGCKFYIGGTVLAKFNPKDLSEKNVHAILPSFNSAKLLSVLDEDSDVNNGFKIDKDKIDDVLGNQSIDFSQTLSDNEQEFIFNLYADENSILTHMQTRIKNMIGGKTYYAYSGSDLLTISFNSDISKITINGNTVSAKKFFNVLAVEIGQFSDGTKFYEYFKLKIITKDTITIEDEKNGQHFEIKFYSSKEKAKESLIDAAALRKALEGKTLYQPSDDDDDSGYLEIYKFKSGRLNVTDTYGHELATNASYSIKDGKIVIPGDNPTYSIVSYQKDKFIFAFNSQTMEVEAFFYNKQDALNYHKELKSSNEAYFGN